MSIRTVVVRIGCSERRIQSTMREHMANQGWPENSYYPQDHAGGPIFIEEARHTLDILFSDLPADVNKVVIIYSHQDCAGCKKRYGRDTESKHIHHLLQAYQWVVGRHNGVRLRLFFIRRKTDDDWRVEQIHV